MEQARLVERAKKGEKDALLQLIMAEKDAYYRLALAYMKNEHDALDALEDMIVTLYEQIGRLKKNGSFSSWSKTILVNRCKQALRKSNRMQPFGEMLGDNHESGHVGQAQGLNLADPRRVEERMDLQAMLDQLNEDQQEAIRLKYYHDLDDRTIAQMTEVSLGTVKSRIFYGLKKLRALSGRDGHEGTH
ncbi:sigma-70 family RNA polymerase sigma factor [Gorillibacterium sp. CAU 1737]|uniref:sigma-70 family RNA polymerase sigma factor n=1 Tax=Gorillibacterium sp. CAU 1737 TaxID=3140362 RepID=UPI00325FEE39